MTNNSNSDFVCLGSDFESILLKSTESTIYVAITLFLVLQRVLDLKKDILYGFEASLKNLRLILGGDGDLHGL